MTKLIINLLIILSSISGLMAQKNICDLDTIRPFLLRKDSVFVNHHCDLIIITKDAMGRFEFLNEEYGAALDEGLEIDSLYRNFLDSMELNTDKLVSIYRNQKSQIDNMNDFVVPNLTASIDSLRQAKEDLNMARESIDEALGYIKKSKNKKWVYAAVGFLVGGLTVAIID